jgi:hypothetical protein
MDREVWQAIAAARARMGEVGEPGALEEWRTVTARARTLHDEDGLAFGLRHLADRALHDGRADEALRAAEEAARIYRSIDGRVLDLANSLRLAALAEDALDLDSAANWREARTLYQQQNVGAGVAECDARLIV